jgi:DNA-binding MarR family transcriptional regulator
MPARASRATGPSTPPSPGASESPAVAGIRRVIGALRKTERRVGTRLRLHPTDLAALEHLGREGELTPSQLAERLDVSSAAVTFLVDRLASAGHLTRASHPSDRRKTVLRLAESSGARIAEIMRPIDNAIADHYTALSARDRRVVDEFLEHVTRTYETTPLDDVS